MEKVFNKEDFIAELKKRLKRLPFDEQQAAIEYYEGYLADGGEIKEPAATIAANIIADFAANNEKTGGLAKVWIILLAIFASPIALPLLFAFGAVAIALIASAFSIIIALYAAAFGLLSGGLFAIIGGICVALENFATTILFIGGGLIAISLGYFLTLATIRLTKFTFNGIAKLFYKFLSGRVSK